VERLGKRRERKRAKLRLVQQWGEKKKERGEKKKVALISLRYEDCRFTSENRRAKQSAGTFSRKATTM